MSKRTRPPASPHATTSLAPVLPVRDNVHFPRLNNTLLVGREISHRALQSALRKGRAVLVVGQRDATVEDPRSEDLFRVGTLSEVMQVLPMPDGNVRVLLRGLARAQAERFTFRNGFISAEYRILEERSSNGKWADALRREAVREFLEIAELGKQVPLETIELLPAIEDCGYLADLIATHLNLRPEVKQSVLEQLDTSARLEMIVRLLTGERQVLEIQSDIRSRVEKELGNTQREYYLREQLKAIQRELNAEDGELSEENQSLLEAIRQAKMPEEIQEKAIKELRRLERSASQSPEGMVIRTYLDWLVSLPWNRVSEDRLDVLEAAKVLDRDHYGLVQVKDRILDFLAVRQLSQSLRGPILCFVGPPGVGKTSIGRSIAEALGRRFTRVSLGGVRDEAEIRGHRRTYIGSMPGRIIQGIKQCGTRNPVFMLDEVDKMTADFRGDPTSALLEALDPEQNAAFVDHYIDAPFDLSAVMFITTANLIEDIPAPLRDRMEIIRFPSYTEQEKLRIAEDFLVPKTVAEHGLRPDQITLAAEVLTMLVREYTREAGVRSLQREIATLCRKTARCIAEGRAERVVIDTDLARTMLGKPRFRFGTRSRSDRVGAATGLVYTEFGGDVVTIEASLMPPFGDQPEVRMTGSLGEVMRESALAAVTYVRSNEHRLSPDRSFRYDVHVHVPEGAVPKDGPSAGLTIALALASAFTGRPIRADVAVTGEITLLGNVLPIGGVREKVLAAHRAGIRTIVLPKDNLADLDELPEAVRSEMDFHGVEHIAEAVDVALTPLLATEMPR